MPERAGHPVPAGSAVRLLLVGDWAPAYVEALRTRFAVVDPAAGPALGEPVAWVLVAAGPQAPALARTLLAELRATSSPDVQLAVLDLGPGWPAGQPCDVYLGASVVEPEELLAALRLADRGFRINGGGTPATVRPSPAPGLTRRENELLTALCVGLGNDQIARRFHISRSTVEFHLTRIFKKLEVSSRAEAIVRVMQPDPLMPPTLRSPSLMSTSPGS